MSRQLLSSALEQAAKVYSHNQTQESDQLGIEILNTNNIEQYAYLIKMLDSLCMERLRLENYAIKLNLQNDSQEWNELTKLLQILSVSYVAAPNLTKNLENPNEMSFEFVSRDLGADITFICGKCYAINNNIQNIQAKIDINKLIILVEKQQSRLLIPENLPLHVVIPIGKEQRALALLLADKLQSNSLSTDVILEDISLPDMMAKANKLGAKYVLIVGQDEQRDGTVTIKNMQKGDSTTVKQSEIISYLK